MSLLLAAMFKIIPNPTFTCPVPLSVPGVDKPLAITITFKHKSRRELADYQARAVAVAMAAEGEDAPLLYVDYVAEIIDTWAGVGDAAGKPLPYSRETLAQLLEAYPASGPEIVRTYTRQLSHARAGN